MTASTKAMTTPTMSAEERASLLANAAYMYFGSTDEEFLENFTKDIAEQIRQAEQAAFQQGWNERDAIDLAFHPEIEKARADERRKMLEEAALLAQNAEITDVWKLAAEIRALANQPSEPGEAAGEP